MYRLDVGTRIRLFLQNGINEDFFRDLKEIKRQGFQCVEVSLGKVGGYKMHMERCMLEMEDGFKAVQDEGLVLNSIHLPFQRFIYLSSCDEGVRAWTMDEFRKLISICDKYNPKHYVFHSKMGSEKEGLWDARKPALVRSFRDMVGMTQNNICMENMVGSFPKTVAHMLEILEQVENGKCCIDINHFLQDKPEDAILTLGKWLTTVHISDHDGVAERHWLPKQGANDWMKILAAFEQVGYNGAFLYEVEHEKLGLSYADLRKNYEELFDEYNKLR